MKKPPVEKYIANYSAMYVRKSKSSTFLIVGAVLVLTYFVYNYYSKQQDERQDTI